MLKALVFLLVIVLVTPQNCFQGCFECDQISNTCTACYEGFQLTTQGKCVRANINGCSLYAGARQCLRCQPTYMLLSASCIRDYSGCLKKDSQSCAICSSQLRLIKGTCKGTLNCKKYKQQCVQCDPGFRLVGKICVAVPINCLATHYLNGVCVACRKGYDLVGFKCISTQFYNPNCYIYNDQGTCQICKDGYLNIDGICFGNLQAKTLNLITEKSIQSLPKMISNIQSTESKKVQQKSSAGIIQLSNQQPKYTLNVTDKNQSYQNKNQILEAVLSKLYTFCKITKVNNVCSQCYQGYFLQSGLCFPIDPYCKDFNHSAKSCIDCYTGYTLNDNHRCALVKLDKVDPNCKVFQNKVCLICYPHYHIKLGICIEDDPLCKTVNVEGACSGCYSGYILDDGECKVDPSNNPNIYDPFCIKIKGSSCQLCTNGYYLNTQGYCTPLSLNCLSHNAQGKCVECFTGYTLISQQCKQTIQYCLKYSPQGKCSSCSSGYYIKSDYCYKKDTTCQIYSQNGQCSQCIETYFLMDGQCIFPTLGFDPLCKQYKNSFCVECMPGSFLANYRCQAVDINCEKFDQRLFRCLKCANQMSPKGIGCY